MARSPGRPAEQQVRAYVLGQPNVGRLIVARLTGGASQAAVLNGAHADQLAERLANHLKDVPSGAGVVARPALHVFMAAPYSFAFFLGRHIKVFRPVTLYDFDFDGERGGGYVPSLTIVSDS